MEAKLFQYFNNTLSEQERTEVEAWIDSSEENRKTAQSLYWVCYAGDTLNVMRSVDTKAALRKVLGRDAHSRRRQLWNRISHIAAMLFIPVVGIALWQISHRPKAEAVQQQEAVQYVEMRTLSGMVSCVTLPDSSKVWLNSNSYLKYPVRFQGERCVELVGEGYFDVTKDPEHKFIVKTNAMVVEVLGTEFNVDAHNRGGRDIRTTLVEGSINLSFEGNDNREHMVSVCPGQMVSIDPATHNWSIQRVDTSSTGSWKEGRIIFDKTPFREALRMIENRYNVEFVVKNSSYNDHNFTGQFTNQRLDIILEHFKRSSNMRFRTKGGDSADNLNGYQVIEIY